MLQALVAGNAVALKPAPGAEAVARYLIILLVKAGFPSDLLHLLPVDAGPDAVQSGFDLIILTGAAKTGRAVLEAAAKTLTPTICELSGVDPVFVLPGADLELVVRKLVYGARLNNGATCIAPHRVFTTNAQNLKRLIKAALSGMPDLTIEPAMRSRRDDFVGSLRAAGVEVEQVGDVVVFEATKSTERLIDDDLFAPWLAIVEVEDVKEALEKTRAQAYALGASIFGPVSAAEALAQQLPAGSICINDLIIPTADPRLPFGGRGESGFGVTRGPEGLLALTRPVVISQRHIFWSRFG
ncbi:aldehyde dehydrogenase [Neokomagataea thailandica NBRC 106555]|nr:aldehyde dehydrogenase [Neokomagataea thailandica NBRC 106555]